MTESKTIKGKIFHVDMDAKTFVLLKETEYDPKTDEGISRVTVRWMDDTQFTRIDRQHVFTGIEGEFVAEAVVLDEGSDDALKTGELVVMKHVRLHKVTPDRGADLREESTQLVGRFVADANEPQKGVVQLDDRTVPVSLRGSRSIVEVHTPVSSDQIATGFWDATLRVTEEGGGLRLDDIDIEPKEDPRTSDDPALPRVLIIGDSISMNYHESAKAALKGIANYHRVDGNCGPSDRGVLCMELWLGEYQEPGLHWDLIQFNHGLHDLKQRYDAEAEAFTDDYQVPIDEYKENLEREIAIMRKTGAKLMWCSTTPVPNDSVGWWHTGKPVGRRKNEDLVYNQAAMDVIKAHPDILINDLNTAVRQSEIFDEWSKGKDVHYWNGEQQTVVGRLVADAIKKALA